ncbi:uncharacterized protein LOC117172073 isoform X2 [Belonocnema kinseyi]|uniref:uncharacterized protein LOC117172073 isoform X2 n=1 Tax=Belonocnema kinseyi TaxID=2817044 RepID=UPI00143DCFF1|nr:uncharacterized protein LOC117172073 isoform X2 [Belonocnema kinseyi]
MSIIVILCFFIELLTLLCSGENLTTMTGVKNIPTDNAFYYDLTNGKPLMENVEDSKTIANSSRINFRSLPCACSISVCSCCTGINITVIKFNRRICSNLTYNAREFALQMDFLMDDRVLFSNQVSAKYPPPVCIPLPYVPFISLCIRVYEIHTIGNNLHACIDFETRVIHAPILVLHFDCIRMGSSGLMWLNPGKGV